jgi:hypothetical protein
MYRAQPKMKHRRKWGENLPNHRTNKLNLENKDILITWERIQNKYHKDTQWHTENKYRDERKSEKQYMNKTVSQHRKS